MFRKIMVLLVGLALVAFVLLAAITFSPAHAVQVTSSGGVIAAATGPAGSCPPTIAYGSTGNWVKSAQILLNEKYITHQFPNSPYNFSPLLQTDGSFGPKTQAATEDFQKAKHLTVDGIIGPHTWHALGQC